MKLDFNVLEKTARSLLVGGKADLAIRVYFLMADGDPSLDAGYLGKKIGECYEAMGQMYAAKYWYGRAVEENPVVRADCIEARDRLDKIVNIRDIIDESDYILK